MKITFLLFSLIVSSVAFARPGDTLLKCQVVPGFNLKSIEVVEDSLTGSMIVIESPKVGKDIYHRDDIEMLENGYVELMTEWNGYKLSLVSTDSKSWGIEYKDESNTGIHYISCDLKK